MVQGRADGTQLAILPAAHSMTQTSCKRRSALACIQAERELNLRSPDQGSKYSIHRTTENTRTERKVGGEGEGIGQAGLLIIGCREFIYIVRKVLVIQPWQVDQRPCTCTLYLGNTEAEAVERITLAQEAVVIAHVDILDLDIIRVGLGCDGNLYLVCTLGKYEITKPIGTRCKLAAEYSLPVYRNVHRGCFDQHNSVLELVAFGTAGSECIVLFKGEPEIGGSTANRAEAGSDIAEAEPMVRFNKIIEAVPAAWIIHRGFRREREVEVQADSQQRCPVGD